jgi:general secretion pathway protein J
MKRGFSLLEVLIASALMALMGALMLTSMTSSIEAKELVDATSNRTHLVRQAMSRMVDEMSMAYLSNHHARNAPIVRTTTGFKGDRERVDFTAFGYVPRVEDERKSDQRQLSFFLDTDERTLTKSLRRREQANLDDKFEDGGRELTLLPDVSELTFQYWDPQKSAWSEKWDAAGTEQNRLPQRVKISLKAVMDNGQEQSFMTQTKIWLQAPLNF